MYGGITDLFTYLFGSNKNEKDKKNKNKMRSLSAMSEDYKRAQRRNKRK
jgi:hypothetical protein